MCGITGIYAFNLVGRLSMINLAAATQALHHRGPDAFDTYHDDRVGLGHQRLSIIDTSAAGHQPMWDISGRYAITFNGEIFNYRELRRDLEAKGVRFTSQSDTEVLLQLCIHEGDGALRKLNGFFAFCFYDKSEKTILLARDRYGIKPLLYLRDEDKVLFASEMKGLLAYGIEKEIDYASLFAYLQLNYTPGPDTIFRSVKRLPPGSFMKISGGRIAIERYYKIPMHTDAAASFPGYAQAMDTLKTLLEDSVSQRLVADVPLGTFLSGGIDSSVVTALASRHKPDLNTFSIGYKDEKYFDETRYANEVARQFRTHHTVFSLSNKDLYGHLHKMLDHLDEPFADSSAIAVYMLSRETRKHATVALSGDGADELLAGYNKHEAAYRALHPGVPEQFVNSLGWLWKALPQSRSGPLSNRIRQMSRFADASGLPPKARYWRWASFIDESAASTMLSPQSFSLLARDKYESRKDDILSTIPEHEKINDVLYTDTRLVLPGDMLVKADLMSMANSLEVRVPFLDHRIVDFLFSLPDDYKISRGFRKRILQDAFRDILPRSLYRRPKHGFEVPLLKWLRHEMRSLINDDLLSSKHIEAQGIFDNRAVQALKKRLFSHNPGDIHARIWGLVVFQWWWKKWCES